jgi:nucleoid DNA-binding protein
MKNKNDIARYVSQNSLLKMGEAEQVIDLMTEAIIHFLQEGHDVNVAGLGKYFLYKHANRKVRNPKNGEMMILDKSPTMKFRTSSTLMKTFKDVKLPEK